MIPALLMIAALSSQDVAVRPSNGKGGKHGTFADQKLKVDKVEREYRLFVPEKLDLAAPVTLVFAFHGLGDNPGLMSRYSGLDDLASEKRFVLVYPVGEDKRWRLKIHDNDDLAFFDALLEHVAGRYNIDLNRVFAAGMSNGAYFCSLLGALRSYKVAGIAMHSGGLAVFEARGISSPKKFAAIVIHGEDDRIVPVEQGRKARDQFTEEKHPVEYVEVPGLGHRWASKEKINDKIWAFFTLHPMK